MHLADLSQANQTLQYLLEIEFDAATVPVGCDSNYNVSVTAYLSYCQEIAAALDLDDQPFLDNIIYMSDMYTVGNGTAEDRKIQINPLNWMKWQKMSNSDCDVYLVEYLWYCPNNQQLAYMHDTPEVAGYSANGVESVALQSNPVYEGGYSYYGYDTACQNDPSNCKYMVLGKPGNLPAMTGNGDYNSSRCINGDPMFNFDTSLQFGYWQEVCCFLDSRNDDNDLNNKYQHWTVDLDGYYNVTAVQIYVREASKSRRIRLQIIDSSTTPETIVSCSQYGNGNSYNNILKTFRCYDGGKIGNKLRIYKYGAHDTDKGTHFCNVIINGYKVINFCNEQLITSQLTHNFGQTPSKVTTVFRNPFILNEDNGQKDPRMDITALRDHKDSYQHFKIRITTRSEKQKLFDAKYLICGSQQIQPTSDYTSYSEVWINNTQKFMRLQIIPGVGSAHFPNDTQLFVLNLEWLFSFNETGNFIDQSMEGHWSYKYCTINQFTLCEDQNCQVTLNSSQVSLQNYFVNQSHSTNMKLLYAQAPQYLVIQTSNLNGGLAPIFLKMTNNGQNTYPIQKFEFLICGDEQLTLKNNSQETISLDNSTNQVKSIALTDIFLNSKSDCSISNATLTHDNKLNQSYFDLMVNLNLTSLDINATNFTNPQNISSFEIQLTVKTDSGMSATKIYQIDISFFLDIPVEVPVPVPVVEEEPEERGYNTGPQNLVPIVEPWRVELGGTEIVSFQHEIYDVQQDEITFNWQGLDAIEDFAELKNGEQNGIKRDFIIEVDPSKVDSEGLFEFSLVASDELGLSAEFKYSIEFFVTEQETNEQVQEEEQSEKEAEETVEETSDQSNTDSQQLQAAPLQSFESIQFEAPPLPSAPKQEKKTRKNKKKKEKPPKRPAIGFGQISPQGELPIEFNQDFVAPRNHKLIDYSSVFDISIKAGLDGSIIEGNFVSISKKVQGRQLQKSSLKNCEAEGCAAQSKKFKWSVSYHNSTGMGVKMFFDEPDDISTSSYGQDQLILKVKEKSFMMFKTALSNLTLDQSGMPESNCRNIIGSMCKLMPPIMVNKKEIESIETTSENMQNSMKAIAFTNLFMAIFMGGMIQQLLGLIKVIQIVLLQACITMVYPAHLTFFYSLIVQLAELDFLQGTTIYENIFEFKETKAYSPTFEQYEIGDMNFFMNTGSMMVIVFLTTLNFLVWTILYYLSSKCLYKIQRCRKIGILSQEQGLIKKPMQKLFIETYIDIIFAASLNLYAINHSGDGDFSGFFDSFENYLSSSLTLVSVFLGYLAPIYIFSVIYRNKERLSSPAILDQYGVFYEEYNYKSTNKLTPFFTVIALLRRIIIIFVLMRMNHLPAVQCMLFTFNSLFAVISLISLKPYEDLLTNRIEIMNEVTIYINCFFTILFMANTNFDEKALREAKGSLGYVIILNICLNMIINMAIISFQSLILLIQSGREKYNKYTNLQKQDQLEKAEEVLAERIGGEFLQLREERRQEKEAIQFCKEFAMEREWCYQNDIDFRKFPEELKFQEIVSKFNLKERRQKILKEIELRQKVYVAGLAAQRFKIAQNVDAKIEFLQNINGKKERFPEKLQEKLQGKTFKDQKSLGKNINTKKSRTRKKDLNSQGKLIKHFKQNEIQQKQIGNWRSKKVEIINEENTNESDLDWTERDQAQTYDSKRQLIQKQGNSQQIEIDDDFGIELPQTILPKTIKPRFREKKLRQEMLENLNKDKALQHSKFNEDLERTKNALESSINTQQSEDIHHLPGSLHPNFLNFQTLKELQSLNDQENDTLFANSHNAQILRAIDIQTDASFQQELTRKSNIERRVKLLDTKLKTNDSEMVAKMQDESFDFFIEYDFTKFDGELIREDSFWSEQLGDDMPVVCGKQVLLDSIIKLSAQDKFQKISIVKGVIQKDKDKWLENCKNLGYLNIEYSLELEESPLESYFGFLRYLKGFLGCFQQLTSWLRNEPEIEVEFIDLELGLNITEGKQIPTNQEKSSESKSKNFSQSKNINQPIQEQSLNIQVKSKTTSMKSSIIAPHLLDEKGVYENNNARKKRKRK